MKPSRMVTLQRPALIRIARTAGYYATVWMSIGACISVSYMLFHADTIRNHDYLAVLAATGAIFIFFRHAFWRGAAARLTDGRNHAPIPERRYDFPNQGDSLERLMQRKFQLKRLQREVLAAISELGDEACTLSVYEYLSLTKGKGYSHGRIDMTIDRLQDEGYVRTWMSEPLPEPGNRPQKNVQIQPAGVEALRQPIRKPEILTPRKHFLAVCAAALITAAIVDVLFYRNGVLLIYLAVAGAYMRLLFMEDTSKDH
jgi:hypothetical protein